MGNYQDDFDARVAEQLSRGDGFDVLLPSHCNYQRKMCKKYFDNDSVFLNVGCKEDPANLGDWPGCINLDAQDYDMHEKVDMTKDVKNFVHADYFDYTPLAKYDGIVLGEVLEHCSSTTSYDLIKKIASEIKDDGTIIITVPHDPRTKEEQLEMQGNKEEQFYYVRPGVTSWHQTTWTYESLEALFWQHDLTIENYETAPWFEDKDMYWHFFTARKTS